MESWGCVPLGEVELSPYLTQCEQGRGLPPCHWGPSSPPQKGGTAAPNFRPMYCSQTAGWIKMPLDTKIGLGPGHIVLDGDSPSNTMWPGSRPTSMPSFILIHQPFGHNTPTSQTDRTVLDRQDRQTGQRFDSIGRTVLQKVAKN